jgi:hypothetical protein
VSVGQWCDYLKAGNETIFPNPVLLPRDRGCPPCDRSPLYTLLFLSMGWDDVSELWTQMDLLFIPTWYTWYMSMENRGGMILTRKTQELWEKLVSLPLCLPLIPHGLSRTWTQASAEMPVTNRLSHGTSPHMLIISLDFISSRDYAHAFVVNNALY